MRPAWRTLRDGTWLDGARLRRIAIVVGLAYVGLWVYTLSGPGHLDPLGRPVATDFSFFYGTSWAVRHGVPVPSLYDPSRFNEAIGAFTSGGRYLWLYPPTAVFLLYPVASLGYLAGLAAWCLVGLLAYLAVTQSIAPGRRALLAALAFPGLQAALLHGQSSLFVAGLVGGGLVLLPRAPALSGVLLGLASFKPQFGLLLPLALLAGRCWRALTAAAVTTVGLAALAGAAFGPESWVRFVEAQGLATTLLEVQGVPYFKLGSVFAAVRVAGGPLGLAWAVQAAVTLAVAVWLVALWRGPASLDLRRAGTVLATLLAVPYLYDYDLALLGIGIAFWVRTAQRNGWLPWEKTLLLALWMLPMLARPVAQWAHVGLVPLLLAAAAVRISARARENSATA